VAITPHEESKNRAAVEQLASQCRWINISCFHGVIHHLGVFAKVNLAGSVVPENVPGWRFNRAIAKVMVKVWKRFGRAPGFSVRFFTFQQGLEAGERSVGSRCLLLATRCYLVIPFRSLITCVLILVAVDTHQLPVAAVRRIIVVVVILVMDGELTNSRPQRAQIFGKSLSARSR
jgi:hypothetical protein